MRAYSELYLPDAQHNLATLLDWSCNHQNLPLTTAYSLFANSSIGRRFGSGDPAIVAGRSGVELAFELLIDQGLIAPDYSISQTTLDCFARSPEYWVGWVTAYFQWSEGLTFSQLNDLVNINDVAQLYHPYHEMDIRQTCDAIAALALKNRGETNLKRIRVAAGLSQRDLSRMSGVSLRTIQHYEQRQKCINKASMETVLQLCACLCCDPRDLMEPLGQERYEYAVAQLPPIGQRDS